MSSLLGSLWYFTEAEITAVEMEMYQAFHDKGGSNAGASAGEPVTLTVSGMGEHLKWAGNPVAGQQGIKIGMRLTAIEGLSLAGMDKKQITDLYSQRKGSKGSPAPASGGFGFGAQPAFGAPAPAFGAPAQAFGAPAPAFGAPAQAFGAQAFGAPAPAFGAPAFGAPGWAPQQFGAGAGFGQPAPGGGFGGFGAKKKVKMGRGFGGGFNALQQLESLEQAVSHLDAGYSGFLDGSGKPVENPASLDVAAPGIVRSADACFYSLDAGMIRAVPCQLTQGRWYFELRHTYLNDARIGFAVSAGNGAPEVKWLTDKRPWPTNGTVGIAVDCDAGTGYLVVDHKPGSQNGG
ncbi:NUP159 [Symbiodinium natans]|uniref:NUP159 protein n=1 Tax=Symbiodinium natans TaxID=878477 RepID=A0A812RJA4_9DINO|nr:NUP159 [Symbiodinium natans]